MSDGRDNKISRSDSLAVHLSTGDFRARQGRITTLNQRQPVQLPFEGDQVVQSLKNAFKDIQMQSSFINIVGYAEADGYRGELERKK